MDHNRAQNNLDLGPNTAPAFSCTSCTSLSNTIHESTYQKCHLNLRGCHICADIARVNDEITSTYNRLFDLIAERQTLMTRTNHDTLIHRMPVEILCSTFEWVREAVLDSRPEKHADYDAPKLFRQPSTSPALLVGAVCKRWRNISLATPQLWTDLTISLKKPLEGQSNMVREWAYRSGTLPLDISIFPSDEDFYSLSTEQSSMDLSILLSTLRSLAPRWKNLDLCIPHSIFPRLLDSLDSDTPLFNTLSVFDDVTWGMKKLKLTQPLRPRRLVYRIGHTISWDVISLELHHLEFLDIHMASLDVVLYIIQHADNLRHFIARGVVCYVDTNNHITHYGLTSLYFRSNKKVLQHLTLPSLQYLDYRLNRNDTLDEIVEFLDRSRAPLTVFTIRYSVDREFPFPPLQKLGGITSLFLKVDVYSCSYRGPQTTTIDNFLALILPSPSESFSRLKKITFELPDLTALSWSFLNCLFQEDADPSNDGTPVIPDDYCPIRKVKSGASIPLSDDITVEMKTRAFLRLLEVKRSGVDIDIVSLKGQDSLIL